MQDDPKRQPRGSTSQQDPHDSPPSRPGAPPPVPASEMHAARPAVAAAPAPVTGRVDHLAGEDVVVGRPRSGSQPRSVSGFLVSLGAGLLVLGLGVLALMSAVDTSEIMPLQRATGAVFWVAAVVVVLLAAVAAQLAELAARVAAVAVGHSTERTGTYTAWLVAATATAAAILLIATYHNVWVVVLGPIFVAVSIFVALLSRDLLDDLTDSASRVASLVHGTVIHLIAFVALSMIYLNKLPEWLSAGLIALVSGLLILETLQRADISSARRLGYAGLGALVMGQFAVAINWWLTWNWTGGVALLVCFYIVAGILLAFSQQNDIRPRDVAFYGGLGSIALAAIAVFSL